MAIHGGAGTIRRELMSAALEEQYRTELAAAVDAGEAVLAGGGSALEAARVEELEVARAETLEAARAETVEAARAEEVEVVGEAAARWMVVGCGRLRVAARSCTIRARPTRTLAPSPPSTPPLLRLV